MKLINFHLSYNWSQDLLRGIFESLEEGELKDLVDEIVPFSQEFSHNLKTILDDDDMKQQGLFSEKPLLLRYKNKEIIDRRSDQEIQDEIDAIENARKKAKEEREAKERAEQERIKKERERKE
jgi:hypothetical protein